MSTPHPLCLARHPETGLHCSRRNGHTELEHRAYQDHALGVGEPLAVWPQERHISALTPLEICGKDPAPGAGYPPCGLISGHPDSCLSGPSISSDAVMRLQDRLTELEEREARVRVGVAEERKMLSGRIDRLKDDTQDAAAAAGEALERTKGLQVSEILRRLNGAERRLTGLESAAVHSPVTPEATTDDRLLSAVRDLTAVMREAVTAQKEGAVLVQMGLDAITPPEPCGARIPFSGGVTCTREKGHDGAHHPLAGSALKTEPVTCHLALFWDDVGPYPCVLPSGHSGGHQDVDWDHWTITGI